MTVAPLVVTTAVSPETGSASVRVAAQLRPVCDRMSSAPVSEAVPSAAGLVQAVYWASNVALVLRTMSGTIAMAVEAIRALSVSLDSAASPWSSATTLSWNVPGVPGSATEKGVLEVAIGPRPAIARSARSASAR